MIRASRRGVLAGALAAPIAAVPQLSWAAEEAPLLLFDASLEAGRRLAQASKAQGTAVRAIDGDRVRVARDVFVPGTGLVIGVSRPADALLIEDVAREAGFRPGAVPASLAQRISRSPDKGLVVSWALAPSPVA